MTGHRCADLSRYVAITTALRLTTMDTPRGARPSRSSRTDQLSGGESARERPALSKPSASAGALTAAVQRVEGEL